MNKIYKSLCFSGLILSILVIYFCTKNPASLQNIDDSIFGKWAWFITIGVFPPHVSTPSTEGYSVIYSFIGDSTYIIYKNDDVIEQGSFLVKYDKELLGLDSCFVISFNDRNEIKKYDNLSIHQDTLILRYRAIDTPIEKYLRFR